MRNSILGVVFLAMSLQASADYWINEDGDGVLRIDERSVSFFSIGDDYYFDQIFTNVRKNKTEVSLCFGFRTPETKRPKACLDKLLATPGFQNDGRVRALHVNTEKELFFTILVQGQLRDGSTVFISVDDGDLYSLYSVNGENALSTESERIMNIATETGEIL